MQFIGCQLMAYTCPVELTVPETTDYTPVFTVDRFYTIF